MTYLSSVLLVQCPLFPRLPLADKTLPVVHHLTGPLTEAVLQRVAGHIRNSMHSAACESTVCACICWRVMYHFFLQQPLQRGTYHSAPRSATRSITVEIWNALLCSAPRRRVRVRADVRASSSEGAVRDFIVDDCGRCGRFETHPLELVILRHGQATWRRVYWQTLDRPSVLPVLACLAGSLAD
ncbi:hypothetical protein F4678DRAFT_369511 [Xylaria arbuscula]|nr:hypothetical protein F4678DRAFT_369511 [Xylaria arbuscula]